MKSYLTISVLVISALLLTGCYTQLQYSGSAREASERPDSEVRASDNVRKYTPYYTDYDDLNWYVRHGFGNYWDYPYYGMLPYGWWDGPGIGFSLRYNWYRDRFLYTPSYAYWNDYIYYNGIVYRSYRFIDDAESIVNQRYAPRTIGTSRLGLDTDNRPLPVRAGTFGGTQSTSGSTLSRSTGTTTTAAERERPSRVRRTDSESTSRTRTTGRSTVGTSSDNSGSRSSSGTARSRDSDSSSSSGTRSRSQ